MYVKVSMIGLSDDLARRLRIAMNLQAAHGFVVSYVSSLGLPADMVIVNGEAPGARVLIERSLQSGRKVVAVGHAAGVEEGLTVVRGDSTVSELTRVIRDEMETLRSKSGRAKGPTTVRRGGGVPIIVRLASGAIDPRANVKLESGDLKLIIRRGASRVLAPSHSDILAAADRLSTAEWRVEILESFDMMSVRSWMSRSLDSFLVRAVRARGVALPKFPDTPMRLNDWPDLAECNDPLAVSVAGMLSRGLVPFDRLVERTGGDRIAVSNLMWAFRAAGVLTSVDASARRPARAAPMSSDRMNILTRIARRFGMGLALS